MASLLSLVEPACKAVKYIYDASKAMSENAHECEQFSEHANWVLRLVKQQGKYSLSGKALTRVAKLCEKLIEIQRTIEGLSKKSWLHRLLWHGDITSQIQKAYDEVDRTIQVLELAGTVDILRMQRENGAARRRDATVAKQSFERLLRSNKDILQALQVTAPQVEEAKVAVRKHLRYAPDSREREVLEWGLEDLERRSRDIKTLPDKFVITSLDVIIHEDLKLGSGGYSQVYLGSWHGTKVAVKVLDKGMSQSLMDREINVWKDLRHPNILAFYGACSLANPPFMVCEHKDNGNVVEYLRRVPDANRCQLLYEASLGLVYLHQNRVIHGDIKGTNILVDHAGKACLADFGLSQIKLYSSTLHAGQSSDGQTQGTLRWMSPEQMLHGELSMKTDIYSFAMTIYEIFTGHPPFSGAPDHAVQRSVSSENARPRRPDDPRMKRLGLTDTMWSVVVRCWDKNPKSRLSAKDLSRRLEDLTHSRLTKPMPIVNVGPPNVLTKPASPPKTRSPSVETHYSYTWTKSPPKSPPPPYDYNYPTYIKFPTEPVRFNGKRGDPAFVPVIPEDPYEYADDAKWYDEYESLTVLEGQYTHSSSSGSSRTSSSRNNSSRTNVTQTVLKLAAEADSRRLRTSSSTRSSSESRSRY